MRLPGASPALMASRAPLSAASGPQVSNTVVCPVFSAIWAASRTISSYRSSYLMRVSRRMLIIRCTFASMSPGIRYFPWTSRVRASAGTATSGPTATIRPSSTRTVASTIGGAPVPSMTVPPVNARVSARAMPLESSRQAATPAASGRRWRRRSMPLSRPLRARVSRTTRAASSSSTSRGSAAPRCRAPPPGPARARSPRPAA